MSPQEFLAHVFPPWHTQSGPNYRCVVSQLPGNIGFLVFRPGGHTKQCSGRMTRPTTRLLDAVKTLLQDLK